MPPMKRIDRRTFIKLAGAGAVAFAMRGRLARAAMAESMPNILWIYCDELRTDALGCYGHPRLKLHTPAIDGMAAGGVRFSNHFCNSPVCVSSRVATLTGQYPEQTGVYNNEAAWKNFRLPRLPVTFPQVFAKAGYATANFGKIHVPTGMYPGQTPGYSIFKKHDAAGSDMHYWSKLGEKKVQMIRSPNGGMQGGVFPAGAPYPPEAVVDNALRWMAAAGKPYLVRVSLLQPHTPVLPPERFYRLYADQDPGLPEPLPPTVSLFERRVAEVHGLQRMAPEMLRKARQSYYAQVAWVDSQVERLLDFLKRAGQLENTIVILGADHGTPVGDTGAFEKHTFTPTVHRVPFVISWPARLKTGQVRDDICDSIDLGRTLFAAAGIAAPDSFRGRDLFATPAPEAIYSTIGYGEVESRMGPNGGRGKWFGDRGWPRRSCIRTARFRLDKNMRIDGRAVEPRDADIFLADVLRDPREMVNLAGDPALAGEIQRLSGLLDKHARDAVEVPRENVSRGAKSGLTSRE